MKRLIISAFLAVALLAGGAAAIHRSRSLSTSVGTAGMPTMQELHGSANVDKLRAEDFEDRSLEYPRETRRSAPPRSDPFVSFIGP
jgi:hypothetical protein